MRKGIIYLLMSIFLLFVAENSHSLDIQTDNSSMTINLHFFSFSKKIHLNQSFSKNTAKHIADSVDFTEDNAFGRANTDLMSSALFALSVASVIFLISRAYLCCYNVVILFPSSIKRYLLLRSIQI